MKDVNFMYPFTKWISSKTWNPFLDQMLELQEALNA